MIWLLVLCTQLTMASLPGLSFNSSFLNTLAANELKRIQSQVVVPEEWTVARLQKDPLQMDFVTAEGAHIRFQLRTQWPQVTKGRLGRWIRDFDSYGLELEKHEIKSSHDLMFWLHPRFSDTNIIQRILIQNSLAHVWTCSSAAEKFCKQLQ